MAKTKISYSTLKTAAATVNSMLNGGFGVVTVCNAKIYDYAEDMYYVEGTGSDTERVPGSFEKDDTTGGTKVDLSKMKVDEIVAMYEDTQELVYLKTLKTATASTDGPNKTVTGGQYANTLIKYGKTARLEIQDALGTAAGLAAMTGAVIEDFDESNNDFPKTLQLKGDCSTGVVHFGSNFAGPKTIIGDTFFIDQKTGAQVKLKIIFYQVNPDSTFTLTQDAEGDATVFDMNGDLLTTDILVGTYTTPAGSGTPAIYHDVVQGMFYSVVPADWTVDRMEDEDEAE